MIGFLIASALFGGVLLLVSILSHRSLPDGMPTESWSTVRALLGFIVVADIIVLGTWALLR